MRPPRSIAASGSGRAPLPSETRPGTPEWRRARAREIVRDHAILAAGANLIPVPLVDSLVVAAVQLKMLAALSRHYGRRFDEDLGRNLLAGCGIGFIHHVVTRHGAAGGWRAALRAVPVFGRALSLVLWPAVFALFTHLLGEACARHYEAGGEFGDFRAQSLVNTPFAPLALDFIAKP